jgi:hypothetical protein
MLPGFKKGAQTKLITFIMKKLQLAALRLGSAEVLSRSQMKNIMGGSGTQQPCFEDSNCSSGRCMAGYCTTGNTCASCPPPNICSFHLGVMQCTPIGGGGGG